MLICPKFNDCPYSHTFHCIHRLPHEPNVLCETDGTVRCPESCVEIEETKAIKEEAEISKFSFE